MKPLLICAAILTAATAARAEDIDRGRELAERWCAECHVIGPGATGGDAGPAFAAVAARPLQTVGALRNWLAEPHEPMPDPMLGAREIDDLAAYIMSLAE